LPFFNFNKEIFARGKHVPPYVSSVKNGKFGVPYIPHIATDHRQTTLCVRGYEENL